MEPENYFNNISNSPIRRKYEALKDFYQNKLPAEKVAEKFGFSTMTVYSMARDLKKQLQQEPEKDPFFYQSKKGRAFKRKNDSIISLIVSLRKKNLSVPDIKSILDTQPFTVSESYIDHVLKKEGFLRLPRRSKDEREKKEIPKIDAVKSCQIDFNNENFSSSDIGILCFLPYIKSYGLDKLIKKSKYPETSSISKLSSIMSFIALKLSNVRRYTADDLWCMDRGIGLFAGLNVLPKAAWFTSYSDRINRDMNIHFLKELHKIWIENSLIDDTMNIDFTTIPYWGKDVHLENNWSGKRRHALSSMLAVIAQDQDSGIIDYADTDIMHKNKNDVVLEFLDFYKKGNPYLSNEYVGNKLEYIVFDSKFTSYQNLSKLDDNGVKFITIRRRGKKIVQELEEIPKSEWKKTRVACAGNKKRNLKIHEKIFVLKGYQKKIRQIAITGHGKIKPALIITNDFDLKTEAIIRKYTRRWIVEKSISEQIEFFHLNRVSSSVVIKVDFDLTMSITAHNLYRLIAKDFERYENLSDITIYEEFIKNSGDIEIEDDQIKIKLKKKRKLPIILTALDKFSNLKYPWMKNKKIVFVGATRC